MTQAAIAGRVMTVGKAILVAVIILIVLGELFATGVVAEPWLNDPATDRVVNESHAAIANGGQVQVNVTADYYYDDATASVAEEVVYNATSGAELTEGTDYEFWSNGTLENNLGATEELLITYSYYDKNVFQTAITTFGDYGSVAFTMIGLGLIAAGAAAALAYFGEFGGGSR